MALHAYTPERREVKHRGKALAVVRGLSLEDVAVLLRTHLPDLDALISLFKTGDIETMDTDALVKLALPVVTQAPGFAANAIALAADAPDKAPMVQKWPFSVQVAAFVMIFELTFSEIGEVKKVLGIVAALRNKVTPTVGVTKKKVKAK